MEVILAHPGTQYSAKIAEQLQNNSLLSKFITGFSLSKSSLTHKIASYSGIVKVFENRLVDIPGNKLVNIPLIELYYKYYQKKYVDKEIIINKRNRLFQNLIKEHYIKEADIIVGFDTSSWILQKRAKKHSKKFILDQSIAHPLTKKRVFAKIKCPLNDLSSNVIRKERSLIDIEIQEHKEADIIVAASTFTKNSLIENGVDENKIKLNPYGVDCELFRYKPVKKNEKIRFLFVGGITIRKGVPLLLKAWQQINSKDAELILVGWGDEKIIESLSKYKNVKFLGKINHRNLPAIFSSANVFIFPSYFEGFGLVILEALSAGLPVITTEATAGPDIIRHGKDGFIFPSGNLDSLVSYMNFFINNEPRLYEMSYNAREKALKYTWEEYGKRWSKIIAELN